MHSNINADVSPPISACFPPTSFEDPRVQKSVLRTVLRGKATQVGYDRPIVLWDGDGGGGSWGRGGRGRSCGSGGRLVSGGSGGFASSTCSSGGIAFRFTRLLASGNRGNGVASGALTEDPSSLRLKLLSSSSPWRGRCRVRRVLRSSRPILRDAPLSSSPAALCITGLPELSLHSSLGGLTLTTWNYSIYPCSPYITYSNHWLRHSWKIFKL